MNKFNLGLKSLIITKKTKNFYIKSLNNPQSYSLQFRNDYLVKKISKAFKSLNIKVNVFGYENLPNGSALIVANHQDNIDALVIMYALKKQSEDKSEFNKIATFIAKESLQYKKTTRYPLNSINTFFLDRNNLKKSLETYNEFGKFIKENKTYGVVFPEGTRNKEGKISEFKPGALKVAKKEFLPIIPVTINNSVQGFNLQRKKTLNIDVIFHKKINPSSFVGQNTISLAERIQKTIESKFTKPEFEFIDSDNDEDKKMKKAAAKWHKKEAKRQEKEAKKERKIREQERKILEAEEKEEQKLEKYIEKKNMKNNLNTEDKD